jgi:hypothetical protein
LHADIPATPDDVAAEALSELDSWSAASLRLNPHRLWEFGTREHWLLEHGGKPVRVIERSFTSCPEGREGTSAQTVVNHSVIAL